MYITISGIKYTQIKALAFAPEIDITGGSIPVSEFQADIVTSDVIPYGELAYLYDDLDGLWAMYRIVYAERVELESVRVRAQSRVAMLENMMLPEVMYETATPLEDILRETFTTMWGGYFYNIGEYEIDAAFQNTSLKGYFPEQKARERLQWVLYAIGGYVKDFFGEALGIKPIPLDGEMTAPAAQTFYKPKLTFKDYVTGVWAVSTEYTKVDEKPEDREQKYIEVGEGNYYLITTQEMQIGNPDVPENAPPNVAKLKDMGIIGPDNVSGLLARMGDTLFNRMEVDLDCVNNGLYMPGQYLRAYIDKNRMAGGVVTRCDFRFGVQARSSIKLTGAEELALAQLSMVYTYGETTLGQRALSLPVGHEYEVQSLWIDRTEDGENTIYRALDEKVAGVMPEGGAEVEVPCAPYPKVRTKFSQNGDFFPEPWTAIEPAVVKVSKVGDSVTGLDKDGRQVTVTLDENGYLSYR